MQQVDKNRTLLRLNEVVNTGTAVSSKQPNITSQATIATPSTNFLNIIENSNKSLKTTTTSSSSLSSAIASPLINIQDDLNNLNSSSISIAPTIYPNTTHSGPKTGLTHDHFVKFLIQLTAGALGGAVSRTATAPIDRLRTMFQVQSVEMNSNELSVRKLWNFMLLEGKWQSLWRGNLVNVLKTAPENAIRLSSYERLKTMVSKNRSQQYNPIVEKLACGSLAGFLSTLILYPLKTVKTIMNIGHTGEFKSIADCIRKTYRAHGIKAFYRGLIANSIAIIPSAGIDLATYETLKQNYSQFKNQELSVPERIVLGNISSTLGNFVVYPLFFARTRLQSNRNPNETTLSVLVKVWRRDGIPGVYRGFFLHILKIGPAASISYVTFEAVNKFFSIESLT